MLKILAAVSGAVALGFCGLGAYRWHTGGAGDPLPVSGVSIEAPDRDVGTVAVGTELDVEYRVTNTGSRTVRIVGAEGGGCGQNCCFHEKHIDGLVDRADIAPGQTLTYPCVLRVRRPGPIAWEMTLFVEENGIRNVKLSVRGVAVGGPGGAPAP